MAWKPDYVTSAELKAYLRISDTVDDTEIAAAVTAASRAVDEHCNRQFGQVATLTARTYNGPAYQLDGGWAVDVDDISDTDDLIVMDGTTELTDFVMGPNNAPADGLVYTRLVFGWSFRAVEPELVVTGLWGWPAVPAAVKSATKLQAARFLARRDSPYGIAGSPTEGSELRLLSKVDPDVGVMLRGLRRARAVG